MNKFSIAELADSLSARYEGNSSCEITGVNGLELAGPNDASFLANPRYKEAMKLSKAGVICIDEKAPRYPDQNYLVSEDPSRTFQKLVEILFSNFKAKSDFEGIHPSAVIHPSAKIGKNVLIGPNSVIDGDVEIGEGTFIAANVTVLRSVKIGKDCTIYPSCVIREGCILKNQVILQPGVIIGSCGFGYTTSQEGIHTKLEQVGNVVLEDDVEIGANTTIDRARFKTTIISKGSKIDNLVQIAHNVEIGKHNIIAAQTGISGSTKTGRGVMFGGQCGILGHIEITDFSLIATRSGISKSIKTPGKYQGSPAMPMEQYRRQKIHVRKLESYLNRIKDLEQEIQSIKEKLSS